MDFQLTSPPPEWAPQQSLLIGWPSHTAPWGEPFEAARREIAGLANLILEAGERYEGRPTKVCLVLEGQTAEEAAREAVPGADILNLPCGDTWLRDTAPVFSIGVNGLEARRFQFNGWGGKYIYPGDQELAEQIALALNIPAQAFAFVLEGGSVGWDGAGRMLTTEDCLLNPNRNPDWNKETAQDELKAAFQMQEVIWLVDGLLNDHTDGHVDNLARFVGPGHVVCQSAQADDPQKDRLEAVELCLRAYRDANGQGLKVSTIPSPGRVLDEEGSIAPASHMNFIVTNQAVIVPAYNAFAETAVDALKPYFPRREVLASSARAILTGGGAFHCISQQIPALQEA